jgi:hypothetical protein
MKLFPHAAVASVLVLAPLLRAGDDAKPSNPVSVSVSEEEAKTLPPTFGVRMKLLWKMMYGGQAALETLPGTASDHLRNFPGEWGRGVPGLAKRFGNQYGQFVLSESIEAAVAALHKEDPRYFYSKDVGAGHRLLHAMATTWVNRKADGSGNTIALSRITGNYGAWAVASRWNPQSEQGIGAFVFWGSVGMATKMGANVMREFWPDVKRKFSRKHDVVAAPPPDPLR